MSRDAVPSPYVVHVHPYPTRFHGGQWQQPVFGMPYVHHVQQHLRPVVFEDHRGNRDTYLAGYGAADPSVAAPGDPSVIDTTGVPLVVDARDANGNEPPPLQIDPSAPWGGNNGMFRTHGEGGGIFNRALAGDLVSPSALVAFVIAGGLGYAAYWYLSRK